MSRTYDELKQELGDFGISRTIYALVMPETEAAKNRVFDGFLHEELERLQDTCGHIDDVESVVKAVHRARLGYYDQFRGAWTGKQDAFHKEFFNTWLDWARPIADIDGNAFAHRYPTAGASEGLRDAITQFGNRARHENFSPQIFTFTGEYEGYDSIAKSAHIPVESHSREDWRGMVEKIAEASKDRPVQLYLSQPSAIDGNVWKDYDAFMEALAQQAPNAEVILDLTYVGCIAKETHIRTDHPNITSIAFSLSKPMGAYYDRVGGFISKEPCESLVGNMWFKNITSLNIGLEFIKSHTVYELPRKYASKQQEAIDQLIKAAKSNPAFKGLAELKPSDVCVLATAPAPDQRSEVEDFVYRPNGTPEGQLRVCVSPMMARMIGTAPLQEQAQRSHSHEGVQR